MAKKLYISKRAGVIALVLFFVGLLGLGVGMFFLFNKTMFSSPEDEYKPLDSISLNQSKSAPSPAGQKVAGVATSQAQSLDNKNQPQKLTIVFFYDGYDVQEDALGPIEVMKGALNLVEPYKSLKDFIDIKVFTTDGKKCKVDDKSKLLVCNKELIESFRKLGTDHFKVILMSPDDFSSTAPLAYGKNSWISISTNHKGQDVSGFKRSLGFQFTNLLGHSLGLKYEYKNAENIPEMPQPPPGVAISAQSLVGRPNCAPDLKTAQMWWGNYAAIFPGKVNFYKGCGWDKEAYYPEQNTLMSDDPKQEGYGIVSEDYLRGALTCFYGGGDSLVLPAGKSASESARIGTACSAFTGNYPRFWLE